MGGEEGDSGGEDFDDGEEPQEEAFLVQMQPLQVRNQFRGAVCQEVSATITDLLLCNTNIADSPIRSPIRPHLCVLLVSGVALCSRSSLIGIKSCLIMKSSMLGLAHELLAHRCAWRARHV